MFFLGCAVGYMLVFPFTFRFLTEYQLSTSIVNQISLTSYMGNFLMLIFVMGIVFELPLLAWLLSKMGLVTKSFFPQARRGHPAGAVGAHHPLGRPVHADGRLPADLPALRARHQIFEGLTPTSVLPKPGFPPWKSRFFISPATPGQAAPGKMQARLRLLPACTTLAAP